MKSATPLLTSAYECYYTSTYVNNIDGKDMPLSALLHSILLCELLLFDPALYTPK